MNVFHSLKWLRGIVMELAGVGLIIWLATGLPGVPGAATGPATRTTARPAASQATRDPANSAEVRNSTRAARRWLGAWRPSEAATKPVIARQLPADDARVAYTQARLEPAGQALRLLVEDAVAGVLQDLTTAGTPGGTPADSRPAADGQP